MQQLLHRVEDIFAKAKDIPPPRSHDHGPLYVKQLEKVGHIYNENLWIMLLRTRANFKGGGGGGGGGE
jgi:hypothetical protein